MGQSERRTIRLADVATAAGVSKATASNVFNRPEVVRSEVRERVLAAAAAIGYRGPDPKGRLLSAGRVNAIGVATTEPLSYFFEDSFARLLMTGITAAADESGTGISLVSAASNEELAWNIRNALVDGFILFCLEGTDALIALSRERLLPFVALSFGDSDETVSVVAVDDVAASRLAAEHLTGLGHRRFAVLAMEFTAGGQGRVTMERVRAATYVTSAKRIEGYFAALAAAGIDTGTVPVFETLSDEPSVHAALEALFAAAPRPTAILAESDAIALIALRWLKARGIAVPGEVSIIGFDGVPEAEVSDPPLTTIRQPVDEMGRHAVKAILEHGDEVWRETLAVSLVVRQSTAPPPA